MIRIAAASLAFIATPLAAAAPAIDLSTALASQAGNWTGSLDYRDYQADKWFGLPVKVSISDGGDGVTQLRVADFDDGPRVGNVRITTVTMLAKDGSTEHTATFRKGRDPELARATLSLVNAIDVMHWTIVATSDATDDDRPARIRVTTVRDGDSLTALKEVDFTDDAGETWLTRNRSVLRSIGPGR